jgi:hypothetical protein
MFEIHGGKRNGKTTKKLHTRKKVTILKKHFAEKIPVSNLCDQYGLNPIFCLKCCLFLNWNSSIRVEPRQFYNLQPKI